MEEFIFAVQQLERLPVVTACFFAAITFGFLREKAQSGGLALISIPVVLAGSLLSHYLLTTNAIILSDDKDTNIVAGVAVGMLIAFAALMAVHWLTMVLLERNAARKKLQPLSGSLRTAK